MNATRPEADSEYSRADRPSEGDFARSQGARGGRGKGLAIAVLVAGLLGAVLLVVAEFTPLLTVHSSATGVVETIQTGSHDSFALVPIALLAGFFSFVIWRNGGRLALLAIALLGIVALLISLLGDLPDAEASGFIGNLTTASSTPAIGLYLETLGGVLLLLAAGTGMLGLAPPERRQRRRSRPQRRTAGDGGREQL